MKQLKRFLLLSCAILSFSTTYAASSILGQWTTIDDKTGQKRAIVELYLKDDVLNGKIIKVYKQKGDTGLCTQCPDSFKNKPIQGLEFLWGLKPDNYGNYIGGHILDAKTGKIYNVKLTQKERKLYVRGFVGISLLGRTQIWVR